LWLHGSTQCRDVVQGVVELSVRGKRTVDCGLAGNVLTQAKRVLPRYGKIKRRRRHGEVESKGVVHVYEQSPQWLTGYMYVVYESYLST